MREAFEKHTDAFNSHYIDGFAVTLADNLVFRAPGGMAGGGKPACVEFFGGWLDAFQTHTSRSMTFTSSATLPWRRAHSQERSAAFSAPRTRVISMSSSLSPYSL